MKAIIELANTKAAELMQMIVRLDIQYNFLNGEYVGQVTYTDGSVYSISDTGRTKKEKV